MGPWRTCVSVCACTPTSALRRGAPEIALSGAGKDGAGDGTVRRCAEKPGTMLLPAVVAGAAGGGRCAGGTGICVATEYSCVSSGSPQFMTARMTTALGSRAYTHTHTGADLYPPALSPSLTKFMPACSYSAKSVCEPETAMWKDACVSACALTYLDESHLSWFQLHPQIVCLGVIIRAHQQARVEALVGDVTGQVHVTHPLVTVLPLRHTHTHTRSDTATYKVHSLAV